MSIGIVLNGQQLDIDINDDFVICADGGYNLLKNTNQKVHAIIGDFDSIDSLPTDTKVIKYPAEKNYTDGELCIRYAINQGYKQINLYAALGGRVDHLLGNLGLLKLAHSLGAKAIIRQNNSNIMYAENQMLSFNTSINDTVSILPFGGNVTIASSSGLYYPLENLTLQMHISRGISNKAISNECTLDISKGGALVFHYFNSYKKGN